MGASFIVMRSICLSLILERRPRPGQLRGSGDPPWDRALARNRTVRARKTSHRPRSTDSAVCSACLQQIAPDGKFLPWHRGLFSGRLGNLLAPVSWKDYPFGSANATSGRRGDVLNGDASLAVFRILREGLNNANR